MIRERSHSLIEPPLAVGMPPFTAMLPLRAFCARATRSGSPSDAHRKKKRAPTTFATCGATKDELLPLAGPLNRPKMAENTRARANKVAARRSLRYSRGCCCWLREANGYESKKRGIIAAQNFKRRFESNTQCKLLLYNRRESAHRRRQLGRHRRGADAQRAAEKPRARAHMRRFVERRRDLWRRLGRRSANLRACGTIKEAKPSDTAEFAICETIKVAIRLPPPKKREKRGRRRAQKPTGNLTDNLRERRCQSLNLCIELCRATSLEEAEISGTSGKKWSPSPPPLITRPAT